MVQTGPLFAPTALAVLVAARAVGALYASPRQQDASLYQQDASPRQQDLAEWVTFRSNEYLRPKDNDWVAAKLAARKGRREVSPQETLIKDVEAEIEHAKESLPDHPELGTLDTHKKSLRTASEHSLWLGGKYRQAMTNFEEVQYISYLEVGNQTLSGIIDTGSFELMVFGSTCAECGEAARYNANSSATHFQGKMVSGQSYGSGDVKSKDAYDMVSIGPYEAMNQSFWEVTEANMPVLLHSAFQAIIGVGPPETPLTDAEDRFRLVQQNVSQYEASGQPVPNDLAKSLVKKRTIFESMSQKTTMLDTFGTSMFSVCIGRQPKSDGYFIWNDTAPLVKPEYFKRVPVVGDHTWSIALSSPMFVYPQGAPKLELLEDETLGCESGCGALLDSGTSLLALPSDVLRKIIEVMQSKNFDCYNISSLPWIHMRLGDHDISLPPDVYIAQVQSPVPAYLQSFVHVHEIKMTRKPGQPQTELRCDMMVMESTAQTSHGPLWILGLPFFRNFYTTFEVGHDKDSRFVHFAKASSSCTPSSPGEGLAARTPHTQLYRRNIDPAKLFVPRAIQRALESSYVAL